MSAFRRRGAWGPGMLVAAVLGTVLGAGMIAPRAGFAQQPAPGGAGARIEELERRFLTRVREALDLDEAQTRELARATAASREQRRAIAERERELRRRLAPLVRGGEEGESGAEVGRLLDELVDLQVRRAEVFRDEQERLSTFLSPLQRARFLYLRQRLVEAARERRSRSDRGGRTPWRP